MGSEPSIICLSPQRPVWSKLRIKDIIPDCLVTVTVEVSLANDGLQIP